MASSRGWRWSFPYWAGALALLGGLSWWIWSLRDPTPDLEREAFAEALGAWQRQAIGDYDLKLRVHKDAQEEERFLVEVRGGLVERLVRNDGDPAAASASYSIAGLFEIIEQELEHRERRGAAMGQRRDVTLRARFHPDLGFPLIFKLLAPERRSYTIAVDEILVPGKGKLFP